MYKLPDLAFAFNALEPFIDAKTMEIHHDKHHAAYVNNLNAALEKYPELAEKPVEELIKMHETLPLEIKQVVVNNAGGHLNHSFFWGILGKDGKKEPESKLLMEITEKFKSFEEFKKIFADTAMKRFGSGWVWLVRDLTGKLEVYSTPNQDSPVMEGKAPIVGLDVWEHAYYLKYQNRRAEYIDAFWSVLDWGRV